MTKVDLQSFPNADELASRVASLWLDQIEAANRAGRKHCVALSGGRITQKFFILTVEQARARKVSTLYGCTPPRDLRGLTPDVTVVSLQPMR